MSDADSEISNQNSETIYSLEYRETQKFKEFLGYLKDKNVCLAVVKCKKVDLMCLTVS